MQFKLMLGALQRLVDYVSLLNTALNSLELIRKRVKVGGVVVSVSFGRGGKIRHYVLGGIISKGGETRTIKIHIPLKRRFLLQ